MVHSLLFWVEVNQDCTDSNSFYFAVTLLLY